jgi:hypothetical protein
MTNVINLNILNVFDLKVNNNQLNINSSNRREKSFSDQRTIDVTPSNPSIAYNKSAQDNIRKVQVKISDRLEVLTCYPKKSNPGNLNAYSADCFMPKGTNIDSYA